MKWEMMQAVSIGLGHNGRRWITIDFTAPQISRRGRISELDLGEPSLFGLAARNLNCEAVKLEPGESPILGGQSVDTDTEGIL